MNYEEKNFISQIILQIKIDKNNTIHILKYSENNLNPFMGTDDRNPFMGTDEEIPLWDLNC